MNNKGFSLIEMLAAVVILGVLGTIAVVGTTKYINQSRKKAYIVMSESIYEAAMNCQTKGDCTTGGYFVNFRGSTTNSNSSRDLIAKGYIDELKNPISKNEQCQGTVMIEVIDESKEYKKYSYTVSLMCPGLKMKTAKYEKQNCSITWPDYKSDETIQCDVWRFN